jgi:hypothetical protein
MATITGTAGNDSIDNSGEAPASSDLYDLLDGNDVVRAGGGDDTMFGGIGNDSLRGDGGNDSILGEVGNDTLLGDAGNDQLFGGDGRDRLEGGAGGDLLFGGADNDSLFGGSENDTLAGGAGADVINGGTGLDYVDYSASGGAVTIVLDGGVYTGGDATGDTLSGIDGIIGSSFDDNLTGFDGQVTTGSDIYTNIFLGGAGNDTLDGRGGNDELYGGADNDSIIGGAGSDLLAGDEGSDTVSGGTGNDTVDGGAGNDTLEGGTGNDRLIGGTGNDQIIIRDGDVTTVAGGDVDTVPGYEFVFGGGGGVNAPDDFDTLDLSAYGSSRIQIVRNSTDPTNDEYENGFVRILDAGGAEIGRVEFSNIERIVPCFTPGTLIRTDRGDVAVEDLVAGDRVLTRDDGFQPLRWVGRRQLSGLDLVAHPDLQPVRIAKGALGNRQPSRSMLVSPQHRVLLAGARVELLFGEVEVLVPAKHLVGKVDATRAMPAEGVTYIHILFDRHQVVLSDGLWTESFQPAERTVSAMEAAVRDEVLALFPELAEIDACHAGARMSLKSHEARVLLSHGSGHAPS